MENAQKNPRVKLIRRHTNHKLKDCSIIIIPTSENKNKGKQSKKISNKKGTREKEREREEKGERERCARKSKPK